jgi:hypothetical protein
MSPCSDPISIAKVIESYSGYGLTKESDISVALQGISQDVVVDALQDRMMAGSSELHLLEELCWESRGLEATQSSTSKHSRSAIVRAPSWSWASARAPIYLAYNSNLDKSRRGTIKVVKCHAPTKQSGELIESSLWIQCQPFLVTIRQEG